MSFNLSISAESNKYQSASIYYSLEENNVIFINVFVDNIITPNYHLSCKSKSLQPLTGYASDWRVQW